MALVLLLLVAQPLLVAVPVAATPGDDGSRAGGNLRVDGTRVVAGTETWDRVVVTPTGFLRVESGGTLLASSVELEGGSRLMVQGGNLLVSGTEEGVRCGIWGECSELLVIDNGVVMVEGVPSTGTVPGGAAWLNVTVTGRVRIVDSQVLVQGGEGHSPEAPGTDGDLSGQEHAGGDALLSITMGATGDSVLVERSRIDVIGGDAGDAPDGATANGPTGGGAGGFTRGGDVSGAVATGGDPTLRVIAPVIEVDGSVIEVRGGSGGDAGDGGASFGTDGGGGGGYSGGAGGMWPSGAGGSGGRVSGTTGSGGEATLLLNATVSLDVLVSNTSVAGGAGGSAGDGGDCDAARPFVSTGGAGGGGYSGGGGGAGGDESGAVKGGDGGDGGAVGGRVARGGDASAVLGSPEARLVGSSFDIVGGTGGRGGAAGASTRTAGDWDWLAGGGGGSYSSGGGAGVTPGTWQRGAGGDAGPVTGRVGDGGQAQLTVDCPLATIPQNGSFSATPGEGGVCWRSSAPGTAGGEGAGRVTGRGLHLLVVPMSRVQLLSPEGGEVASEIPVFTWARPYNGTSAGGVVWFEFEMGKDPRFVSAEIRLSTSVTFFLPNWVPNFTSYWRVRALYQRPFQEAGPWSEARSFTLVNLPPVIGELPVLDVLVGETVVVDLSPYISDPDNAQGQLTLDSKSRYVMGSSHLNLTLYFDRELDTTSVPFTVADTLNTVRGELIVTVSLYRHPPYILGITNHLPPLELELLEGTEAWYDILVHDVDSTEFTYWTTGSWEGGTAYANGTLRVKVARGEVGEHTFRLRVADEGGREASAEVTVVVLNVNDPPDPPAITSPSKRITVREGEVVYFQAVVSDPDLPLGQVLNVTFVDNETGLLRTITTTTLASMSHGSLPVGRHTVTVLVSDGQYTSSDFVEVIVEAPPEPPPVHTSERIEPNLWAYLAASVVLFAVSLVGGDQHRRWRLRRRGGDDRP